MIQRNQCEIQNINFNLLVCSMQVVAGPEVVFQKFQ